MRWPSYNNDIKISFQVLNGISWDNNNRHLSAVTQLGACNVLSALTSFCFHSISIILQVG